MSVILAAGLYPLLSIFRLNVSGTDLLLRVSQGFLVGLLGHSLMEIAARSFYAQKDALTPLKTGALNFVVYIILTVSLSRFLGPAGISLGDSLAFTGQAILLFWLLYRRSGIKISLGTIPLRGLVAAGISGCIVVLIMQIPASGWVGIFLAITGITAGLLITVPFIRNELRLLLHLGD
jgi:putative peptidoglycan lipid II flippase